MPGQEETGFQEEIELHSHPTGSNGLYPRPDLIDLAKFLKEPEPGDRRGYQWSHSSGTASPQPANNAQEQFAVIYDLAGGASISFGGSPDEMSRFVANPIDKPVILFLRGYASQSWLNKVAYKFGIGIAELFQKHLEFEAFRRAPRRNFYSSPSLPSSLTRAFQLLIPTLYFNSEDISVEPEDLRKARRDSTEKMGAYFKHLGLASQVSDSIVRRFLVFSKQACVVEQKATIQIIEQDGGWCALAWFDNGRDLSECLPGPWTPSSRSLSWETYFVPTVVHHLLDAKGLRAPATAQSVHNDHNNHTPGHDNSQNQKWRANQNICLLPFQYGRRLDANAATKDALYALSEVFLFAAAAEAQFLNLVNELVERELSFVGVGSNSEYFHAISLSNLRYIKTQLATHTEYLADTVGLLNSQDWLNWPSDNGNPTAATTKTMVKADYRYLLQRAQALARDAELGMTTIANASKLEEAKRSSQNAMRIQRLTVLATVFIPLSFVCAVWGINVKEFGQGEMPWWLVPLTAIPVLLVSLLIYFFEPMVGFVKKRYMVAKAD